jgi:hypothetical protein
MCSNGTTERSPGLGLERTIERARTAHRALSIGLALALATPALRTGWVADDWIQQLMLRRDGGVPGIAYQPFDLFRFVRGDPAQVTQLIDQGVLPWWAHPQARLAFFRPLASLTHVLDHWLWPGSALLAHLHNLAWYAALLCVVGRCLKRFEITASTTALALLMYAVDDAHAPTVGWIANRNSLLALALSLPALLFHDDWRRCGRRRSAGYAALALGVGLAAGEAALVTCAYLLAYAIFLERSSAVERARSLLPYALVLGAWRALYAALGYGALHSGLYLDPLRAPLQFARAAAERFPALSLAQLAMPWSDFWELYPLLLPGSRPLLLALALLVLGAFWLWCRPLLRRSRAACFWLSGAALGVLPMCATFPHDRLLLGVGIGVAPVLAELCRAAWQRRREWRARAAWLVIVALHLVGAPVLFALRCAGVAELATLLGAADATLPSAPALADETWIIVNPPVDPFAAYLVPYRACAGRARPAHLLWLSSANSPLHITRTGERSLVLRPESGFLAHSSQWMLRSPQEAPRAGETVSTGSADFRLLGSFEGGPPRQVEVVFREALESSRLVWLQWRGHGYAPFTPPAQGQTTSLPAADLASVLFRR